MPENTPATNSPLVSQDIQRELDAITSILTKKELINTKLYLHKAIAENNLTLVKYLIKAGADRNFKNPALQTPLHLAIKQGNFEIVTALLKNPSTSPIADVNMPHYYINSAGRSEYVDCPLHLAIKQGKIDIACKLLDAGADASAANRHEETPLHLAARQGDLKLIEKLLNKPTLNLEARDCYNQTPLHVAINNRNIALAIKLLAAGANPNQINRNKQTPLHLAATRGDSELITQLLSRGTSNLEAKDYYGQTPLHVAVKYGNTATVKTLLDAGAKINSVNIYKQTPVHLAAKTNNGVIIGMIMAQLKLKKFNLGFKNPLTSQDQDGKTPFDCAVIRGNPDLVKLFIHEKIKINYNNNPYARTPLHLAAIKGNLAIAKLLIQHNLDINAQDSSKATPLHYAVLTGNSDLVEFLIRQGANLQAKDKFGHTPLDLALQQSANLEAKDKFGPTPLDPLLQQANEKIIDLCNPSKLDLTEARTRVQNFSDISQKFIEMRDKISKSPDKATAKAEKELYDDIRSFYAGPIIFKSIRFDEGDFWGSFVLSITKAQQLAHEVPLDHIKKPLRINKEPASIHKYTLDLIADKVIASQDKIPQFKPEEKEYFSKKNSASISLLDLQSNIFGSIDQFISPVFGSTKDRKDELVGVLFRSVNLTNHPNILISNIMKYDTGTYFRPTYFATEEEAKKFLEYGVYNASTNPSGTIFKDVEELLETRSEGYNELLVRMKWAQDDPGCQIAIFSNNLKSNLIAQLRACDLQYNLGTTWVPISFYIGPIRLNNQAKNSTKHLLEYNQTQRMADLTKGINNDEEPDIRAIAVMTAFLNNKLKDLKLISFAQEILCFLSLFVGDKITSKTKIIFLEKLLNLNFSIGLNFHQKEKIIKNLESKIKDTLKNYTYNMPAFKKFNITAYFNTIFNEAHKNIYNDSGSIPELTKIKTLDKPEVSIELKKIIIDFFTKETDSTKQINFLEKIIELNFDSFEFNSTQKEALIEKLIDLINKNLNKDLNLLSIREYVSSYMLVAADHLKYDKLYNHLIQSNQALNSWFKIAIISNQTDLSNYIKNLESPTNLYAAELTLLTLSKNTFSFNDKTTLQLVVTALLERFDYHELLNLAISNEHVEVTNILMQHPKFKHSTTQNLSNLLLNALNSTNITITTNIFTAICSNFEQNDFIEQIIKLIKSNSINYNAWHGLIEACHSTIFASNKIELSLMQQELIKIITLHIHTTLGESQKSEQNCFLRFCRETKKLDFCLHQAEVNTHNERMLDLCLQYDLIDLNLQDHNGDTLLHQAVKSKNDTIVAKLLSYKNTSNEHINSMLKNNSKYTPLDQAMKNNYSSIINLLMNHELNLLKSQMENNHPVDTALLDRINILTICYDYYIKKHSKLFRKYNINNQPEEFWDLVNTLLLAARYTGDKNSKIAKDLKTKKLKDLPHRFHGIMELSENDLHLNQKEKHFK